MRFLKNDEICDRHGNLLVLEPEIDNDTLAGNYTIGRMMTLLVKAHNNKSGLELSVSEYTTYGELEDIFDNGPENGWFQFSDTQFDLLQKMGMTLAPKAMRMEIARNSPIIVSMLKDASRQIPLELASSSNGRQEGAEVGVGD